MLPGDPGGQRSAAGRKDDRRLRRLFVPGQERYAGSGDALGAPVQPCGEPLQRDIQRAIAEHHSARLPALCRVFDNGESFTKNQHSSIIT